MFNKYILALFALALVLAACAPTPATPEAMMEKPAEEIMEKPTEGAMMEKPADDAMMEKPTGEAMMEEHSQATAAPEGEAISEDKMMAAPAWFGASLTDVRTGQTFSLNDFKGKVILVETLAMWCPSCKRQQQQVKALHEMLGMNKDLVSIGLDIDPNENASDLKTYTDNNGFDWLYAIAPAEVAREIANLYGDQFLNPPSTPILIIDPKGEAHPLPFGIKSAEELRQFIEPFLQVEM